MGRVKRGREGRKEGGEEKEKEKEKEKEDEKEEEKEEGKKEEEGEEEEDTLFFFPSVALSGLGGREEGKEGEREGGEGEAPALPICFFDVIDTPTLPTFSLLSFLLVTAASSSSSSSSTLLGFHTPSSLPPSLPPSRLSYPSAGCVRIALQSTGAKEGGREGRKQEALGRR